MPRSLWNGTILVAAMGVPVKLYSAVQSQTVSFKEVHLEDGSPIEHRRFCSAEEVEVPYKEVVKGFEVGENEYVVLEKDEITAAAGGRTRYVDVEDFVEADAIDPVYYNRAYYLGPGKDGDDAYRLLHAALSKTGRAAIGRFTFHNKEYLAAIVPLGDILALHTMNFADEVVSGGDLELAEPQRGPTEREVKMAGALLTSLHEDFEPDRYRDEYREAVLDLIGRKAAGEKIEAPAEEAPAEDDDDLMAALQASLDAGAQKKKGR
ncbi:MAG TPA: Ku protein [Solirubrobacteraceae bacterium]